MTWESNLNLIEKQDILAAKIENLPTTENSTRNAPQNQTNDGVMKLTHTTQDLQDAQNGLIRTTRQTDDRLNKLVSDIPQQQAVAQKDSGIRLGFDMDAAGLVAGIASLGLMGATAPISAPVLAGLAGLAGLVGVVKGSYDETKAAAAQQLPVEADLSQLIAPITAINDNVQSILQALPAKEQSTLADMVKPEMFAPLSNLDTPLSAVIQQI